MLTAFSWAVIASTNLWPLLFGVYWKRTSAAGTLASMVTGAAAALLWQAFRARLPEPWNGVHGFLIGVGGGVGGHRGGQPGDPAPARKPCAAPGEAERLKPGPDR